jgi:AbrB family looped-hinge helix DNA binding protein
MNAKPITIRSILKINRSLLITIPLEARECLRLKPGDMVVISLDRRSKILFLKKAEGIVTSKDEKGVCQMKGREERSEQRR